MKNNLLKNIEEKHIVNMFYRIPYIVPELCVFRGDSVTCQYEDEETSEIHFLKGFLYNFSSFGYGGFNYPEIYNNGREKHVKSQCVSIYPCRVVIFEKIIFER